MALEDLRQQGVLLPEDEWGAYPTTTTVEQGPLLVTFFVAVSGLVAGYLGDGRMLTWLGVGGFFLAFYGIVWICDRAIRHQRQRVRQRRADYQADGQTERSKRESTIDA